MEEEVSKVKDNNRVLVVDDDVRMLETYREVLDAQERDKASGSLMAFAKGAGDDDGEFSVTTVTQGMDAVDHVRKGVESGKTFTIAFIDMRMPPGIDGVETVKLIRELDSKIYLVIVTAYTDRTIEEIQEAAKHGVLLLRKPFNRDEVLQLSRSFIQSWKRDAELEHYQENLEKLVEEKTKALTETQAELASAGRLKSLGEMGTQIAHEINNPLNIISLYAQDLEAEYEDDELIQENVGNIVNQCERVANIISNMRAFSGKDKGVTAASSLKEAVDMVVSFFTETFKDEEIELVNSVDADLPYVLINTQKVGQVIMNILHNAQYAVSEQQKTTDDSGYTKKISIFAVHEQDSKNILLAIQDNGIGMSDEVKKKCMDPFFTTKEIGAGTGLGLSVVAGIAQEMDLKVTVESELGKGATFSILIPVAE